MNSLIPNIIHTANNEVLDAIFQQRLDALAIDKVLIYMVDIVDERALYFLAKQFDLLGFSGWIFATTAVQKRALIKGAIELHKYKGTVYAIKRALQSLGYPTAIITEGDDDHWSNFSVDLNIGENGIDQDSVNAIEGIINAYKNARSNLVGITFSLNFDEPVDIGEEFYGEPQELLEDVIFAGGDFKYNGEHLYNGDMNYSQDTDTLEITIL